MIIKENFKINEIDFVRHISVLKDESGNIIQKPYKKIKKIGTDEIYDTAEDLLSSGFEYEETDIEIIEEKPEEA